MAKQLKRPLIKAVDLFAGAGGASTGLVRACRDLGYSLDLLAINHWPIAVETHGKNHPNVVHLCEAVERVDPLQPQFIDPKSSRVFKNTGRFNLLLAGPECTHHSTARGGRPVNEQSRASAWHILKWAQELYIDTILIENVPEFATWGPIGANGRPLKSKKGETFRAFLEALRSLGYRVDYKILNAADYGDPTTRKRLFILAKRGNNQVAWPVPTHSRTAELTLFGDRQRWNTARDKVIDWSIKGKNIFDRPKPLRPATMLRIIAGLEKFGGLKLKPFLRLLRVNCTRTFSAEQIIAVAGCVQISLDDEKIGTVILFAFLLRVARLADTFMEEDAVRSAVGTPLEPFLIVLRNNVDAMSVNEPMSTVVGAGQHHALVDATLVAMEHGGRSLDPQSPLPTITTAKGGAFGVAEAVLVHTTHGGRENSVDAPIPTITCAHRGEIGLAEGYLLGQQSGAVLRPASEPTPTIAAGGAVALVEPFLTSAGGPEGQGRTATSVDEPIPTVLAENHRALIQSHVEPFIVGAGGPERAGDPKSVDEPMGTVLGRQTRAVIEAEWQQVDGDNSVIVDAAFGRSEEIRIKSIDEPLGVIPGSNRYAVAEAELRQVDNEAFLVDASFGESRAGVEARIRSVDEPLGVIPGSNRYAMAEAALVPLYSEREDQAPRSHSVDEPVPSIPATGSGKFGVSEAFLVPQRRCDDEVARVDSVDNPLRTITGTGGRCIGLGEAFLTKYYGTADGAQSVDDPIDTLTARDRHAVVEPFVLSAGGPNVDAIPVSQPMNTVLARDHMALAETFISPQRSNSAPHSTGEPIPTLVGSEHMALIEPFVLANNTNNQPKDTDEPIPTVTGGNRLGLVQSSISTAKVRKSRKPSTVIRLEAPVIDGLVLVILFRMLRTRELARAMSFPDDYHFVGKQEDVVKQIGNAWAGELSKALCKSAVAKPERSVTTKKQKVA